MNKGDLNCGVGKAKNDKGVVCSMSVDDMEKRREITTVTDWLKYADNINVINKRANILIYRP